MPVKIKKMYWINAEKIGEGCANCNKVVLRDNRGEHILLDCDEQFCVCEDIE